MYSLLVKKCTGECSVPLPAKFCFPTRHKCFFGTRASATTAATAVAAGAADWHRDGTRTWRCNTPATRSARSAAFAVIVAFLAQS